MNDKAPTPEMQPDTTEKPAKGVTVVSHYLASLPQSPGVYRMLGENGDVLYVGKAKNLAKRVASYVRPERQSLRIARMVAQTASMEFVTTRTEADALLLEANLIKRLKPRYNILLRDDKSFPEIRVTASHDFPRVLKHRGAHMARDKSTNKTADLYFGPFASTWAVNETLSVLQRAFLLRTCSDTVFANRSRPCLLYQIKRCSAPCVGKISQEAYGELVCEARDFLAGRSQKIQRALSARMQKASVQQAYEDAAVLRDRIRALTRIQAHQDINPGNLAEADIIAAYQAGGHTCVQVFFIRGGRNFGSRAYFPSYGGETDVDTVLEAFIGQFYESRTPPAVVLLSHDVVGKAWLVDALSQRANRKVSLQHPLRRGAKHDLVAHAVENAKSALARRNAESATQRKLLEGLAQALGLESAPERIEVYDNSHVQGAQAVGAMIVVGANGFEKNQYRKFNIRQAAASDDYGMMREVLGRRFARALQERAKNADTDSNGSKPATPWPDLVLVDGGKGQLSVAADVFADLGINHVALAAIAKGPERNAGRERIFMEGREPLALEPRDPVLYFLQRIRDEAHRFAIGTHRAKRSKTMGTSILDEIPGIGPKRKKALLHHFGAANAVADAVVVDLEAVDGIDTKTAKRIYDWFHPDP